MTRPGSFDPLRNACTAARLAAATTALVVTLGVAVAEEPIFDDDFETGAPCKWSDVGGVDVSSICTGPFTIDYCVLQFPLSIANGAGTEVDVYGRLYVAGLTDQSAGNDPAPEVVGYVGWGPDGSDPDGDDWFWIVAEPNGGYGGDEVNNDEYFAFLTIPGPPGEYDFAFAFSGDSGTTHTYCDGDGSANGYSAAAAGQMTSSPELARHD